MENWNSANGAIFYGKDGELTGADRDSQEISMLALHLLQSALVYVNTLLLQRILADPNWADRLTAEDRRALTPLFWTHVRPYGTFHLRHGPAPRPRSSPGQRMTGDARQRRDHATRRTPAKRKARQLAKHLRGERPDYAYLKEVFRRAARRTRRRGPARNPRRCPTSRPRTRSAATTRPSGKPAAAATWC